MKGWFKRRPGNPVISTTESWDPREPTVDWSQSDVRFVESQSSALMYSGVWNLTMSLISLRERDVAQSIACPPLKRSVVGSILLSGSSCRLGYFPFQPVVHNWFIKGRGMYCSVYGKVHIKDPLLLIEKSSLCGGSGFPSKKCVNVTIWMTSNNRW